MITKADKEKLSSLIEAFYSLTGIKVAVYDKELCKMFSYPEKDSPLCLMIQNNKTSECLCDESTSALCQKCALCSSPLTYKCHAGLTEVVTPLTDGRSVIGYIMFGQITNDSDRDKFISDVVRICKNYGLDEVLIKNEAEKIAYYSDKRIEDAAKILRALAGYIVFENIVYPTPTDTVQKILEYIRKNLGSKLTVEQLCREFYISKSELYKIISPYAPEGIAAFIREKRLNAAKELLKKTDKPACIIAEEVGFSDVNYFLRVFKKKVGESAASYRKRIL